MTTEAIRVCARLRPLNKIELNLNNHVIWKAEDNNVYDLEHDDKKYAYDLAFGPDCTNNDIFQTLGVPIVDKVLNGFNGSIFAYGQTSSGKTHTLMGAPAQPGVAPMCINDLFEKCEAKAHHEFLVRISYVEIYNEDIKDLLHSPDDKAHQGRLTIIDDPKIGPTVRGAVEKVVASGEDALHALAEGEHNRHFAATNMNERSSRSHVCLVLILESREVYDDQATSPKKHRGSVGTLDKKAKNTSAIKVGRLNLIDLAGSEKVAKTGATGERLHEGSNINKSLLTLGQVIHKLADLCNPKLSAHDKKGIHVPYRDSKLTMLMKGSIGGNSCTAVVCAVSPASRNYEETKGTLMFANRCKTVVNKVSVNEVADKDTMLAQYKHEIADLKAKLAEAEAGKKEDPDQKIKMEQLMALIVKGQETGADQETMSHIQDVVQGRRRAQSIMTEMDTKKAARGNRRMSNMMMDSLQKISSLNQASTSHEDQVDAGPAPELKEEDEDKEKLLEEIDEKDRRIAELEQEVFEKNQTIEKLRLQLQKSGGGLNGLEPPAAGQARDEQAITMTEKEIAKMKEMLSAISVAIEKTENSIYDAEKKLPPAGSAYSSV